MSNKVCVLWVDLLAVADSSDIPASLLAKSSVKPLRGFEYLEAAVASENPVAVFFDFDYPDRAQLLQFERFKQKHRSTAAVFLTLQHSEKLAIWAFRTGALDYLVKPFADAELENCTDRIVNIAEIRTGQTARNSYPIGARLPVEIPSAPRNTKSKLSPSIFYVRKNYAQKISSDAMARLCGMSTTHFSRAFKQTFNVTFQEFLLKYRIRQACRQLRNPQVSIAEAAYAAGFSDPSYFTRVFKRCTGRSPSEYCTAIHANGQPAANDDLTGEFLTSSSQIVRSLSNQGHG